MSNIIVSDDPKLVLAKNEYSNTRSIGVVYWFSYESGIDLITSMKLVVGIDLFRGYRAYTRAKSDSKRQYICGILADEHGMKGHVLMELFRLQYLKDIKEMVL